MTDLGDRSPYRQLKDVVEVEVSDLELGLHQLIYDVKTYGGNKPFIVTAFTELVDFLDAGSVLLAFTELVDSLDAGLVLLACTELPLIPIKTEKKHH